MILTAVVVATAAVYVYFARKPNIYTASTNVYIQNPGDPVNGTPSPQATDRQVLNQASLLYSRDTAQSVKDQIAYNGSAQDLLTHVTISSKQGEDFVTITARAGTARQSAAIANAFGAVLVSLMRNSFSNRIANAIKLTQAELTHTAATATDVQRANLLDQLNRLQLNLRVPPTVAQQVDLALPPTSPSSPKPLRNALFAFVLSLLGAVALAYGLERFDRRLKTPDDLAATYPAPLLAVVPHTEQPSGVVGGEPVLGLDFREPFRMLRMNIELASLDRPARTIVITSAMPSEGKSTVVRNLALAYREAGKRVVVIDLDLRHPSLADKFGLLPGPGATDVLRHEADLDSAVREVGVAVGSPDPLALVRRMGTNGSAETNGHSAQATVDVLLSGARPANPPAVLASERVIELLDELRSRYDIVLIDSAPVLAVTDTVPLIRYADGVLFVGRLGVTTRDTAKRMRELLERIPDVDPIGVVANDLSRLEAGGYGYGYGYGYGEPDGKSEKSSRRAGSQRPKQTV